MTSSPSYITKNRLGIYCFQYAIPSIIVKTGQNQLKQLFRKSLHTRNRREALKQARFLWLIMDKLADKYFRDPASYGKAMELLKRYDSFINCDWTTIEEQFFDKLDSESEIPLLDSAIKMRVEYSAKEIEQQQLINHYKKLLEHTNHIQTGISPVIYSEKNNPKISFLIQKWLEVRRGSGIKIDSISSLEQRIDIFLKIITELNGSEPTGSELTSNLIREYYELLKKVPAYRKANNLVGKSFIQLSKLGLKPISDKTYAEYTSVVSDFLRWSEGDGYPVNKELAGILRNSKTKGNKKNKKLNSILALPFDDNDLTLIFNNESYLKGSIDRASDYWVPLIALFTGARLGEICQLYLSDIRQEEGIWVIDINDERDDDDEDKSIKSEGGLPPIS